MVYVNMVAAFKLPKCSEMVKTYYCTTVHGEYMYIILQLYMQTDVINYTG